MSDFAERNHSSYSSSMEKSDVGVKIEQMKEQVNTNLDEPSNLMLAYDRSIDDKSGFDIRQEGIKTNVQENHEKSTMGNVYDKVSSFLNK